MHQRLLLLAVLAVGLPGQVLAQGPAARDNIDALIEEQARANGVPSSFVHQVVKRESNYNPNAKGGSALGLMQIKPATARGLGYQGEAAGLFDPKTNLRYGIAYLAGAYRAAKGDIARAYGYYNRGYYYAAKRLGIDVNVADADTTPTSSLAFSDTFTRGLGLRTATDPNLAVATTALAYAPSPTANGVPTELVEVPLPPRRPAAFSGTAAIVAVASLTPAVAPAPSLAVTVPASASAEAAPSDVVEVPLPPRRPSAVVLASTGRPIVAKKTVAPGTVLEASALPAGQ